MTSKRLISIVALAVLLGVGFFVYRVAYMWWHVPEAYAAWDAGVLLVRFMETHEDDWPSAYKTSHVEVVD